jgi:hypothetical protein
MQKFIQDLIFGIALGIGFTVAAGVINFIIQILGSGHLPAH